MRRSASVWHFLARMGHDNGDASGADRYHAAMRERDEPMDDLDSEWQRKGATLSDKTAGKE